VNGRSTFTLRPIRSLIDGRARRGRLMRGAVPGAVRLIGIADPLRDAVSAMAETGTWYLASEWSGLLLVFYPIRDGHSVSNRMAPLGRVL
jgi:hypothetical protein